ncbi:hypothetical protein [Clostridium oryzae]|uniref:Uncharacterized protein n=1 Tax=Clostridium oryzae TaxID=1450648 RepID=A0A1V4IRA5_9CLOT|nr:hypothetical protein [Clostridium oryzae]OPJ62558.1 hypothetical protein CLORY_16880 [Clostridium oryzae]
MNFGHREGYALHDLDNGSIAVVKVLNEYRSEEEATEAMLALLFKEKTEEELIDEYAKKPI